MKFRFVDYVLDTKLCELHRGREPIAAGSQMFYVLAHLMQNGWPIVVEEEDGCHWNNYCLQVFSGAATRIASRRASCGQSKLEL